MTPYPSIMIDVETLGRKPNSVILSIGAVYVDLTQGQLGRTLHCNMDPEEVEFYGMTRDDETVRWWKNQSAVARQRTFDPSTRVTLKDALQRLTAFVYETCGKGRTYDVYACGPQFDISMLEWSYHAVGLTPPWPFWAIRDYRTLREWYEHVKPPTKNKGHHDALYDAIHEAEHLIAIYQAHKLCLKNQLSVDKPTDDEL